MSRDIESLNKIVLPQLSNLRIDIMKSVIPDYPTEEEQPTNTPANVETKQPEDTTETAKVDREEIPLEVT